MAVKVMHRDVVRSHLHDKKAEYFRTEYYYLVGKWVFTYSTVDPKKVETYVTSSEWHNVYSRLISKDGAKYEIGWKPSEWTTVKEMPDKEECIKFIFRRFRKTR